MPVTYFPEEICAGAVHGITYVIENIIRSLTDDPNLALTLRPHPETNKYALAVDDDAENNFRRAFRHEFNNSRFANVKQIRGEETIDLHTQFLPDDGLVGLVDMVDGTDLLERHLSNWCSAAVFFDPGKPAGKRIQAACVGIPSGKVYFAHAGLDEVRFEQLDRRDKTNYLSGTANGCSEITRLENASICFYGQKAGSLNQVAETMLLPYLEIKDKERKDRRESSVTAESVLIDKEKESRIYNLSGIPMMMKLIDHQVPVAANIDVVLQLRGQRPHDAVPGLYIARKGGAFILNLDTSEEMTDEELEKGLLRPGDSKERMRYIVASTSDLCAEMLPLLQKVN